MQSGTTVWFARHEARLAWRDFYAMMTAGRRARRRVVAIGFLAFVLLMHGVAYLVVGSFAHAAPDRQAFIAVTSTLALSWFLMVSQAMESLTRAFYARADLDLILASPVAAHEIFAVRMATVALAVAGMALPLAAPFIDLLAWFGGARWLAAYPLILAMGMAATALAVTLTVALFRLVGPRRTRLVAQIVAAVIGAVFVIGLQVAAILSYGTVSRGSVLQSEMVARLAPDAASLFWLPARAVLGNPLALVVVLAGSFLLLALAVVAIAPRFGDFAVTAAGSPAAPARRPQRARAFRSASPMQALRRKEWLLLLRDPWLASQTLMQMLYLVPPAVLLWKSFQAGGAAANLVVPVLVMAAGQLAGGLAWLTISGEDAPDLVATAPVTSRALLAAKIEAVLGIIAVIFAPLIAILAIAAPRHALIAGIGVIVAAASATAIQLWFRTQAKRSQFRRRQVSSRVATFAEAFSSIGWAATAAVAAISVPLAIAPALMAGFVVAGARGLSPRREGPSS